MKIARNRTRILDFLAPIYEGRRVATYFDEHVTKPLEHIAGHWELSWDIDNNQFEEEAGSFSPLINQLINELARTPAHKEYHKFVDADLAASKYAANEIALQNKKWIDSRTRKPLTPESIGYFLEQTANGWSLRNIILSIASRIRAAQKAGVKNWDELDDGHKDMLAQLIVVVLYMRSSDLLPNGRYVWEHDWEEDPIEQRP